MYALRSGNHAAFGCFFTMRPLPVPRPHSGQISTDRVVMLAIQKVLGRDGSHFAMAPLLHLSCCLCRRKIIKNASIPGGSDTIICVYNSMGPTKVPQSFYKIQA